MELLFSDLPNEVVDIIINNIRIINLSTYFYDKDISFSDLFNAVKTTNCVLTCKFTDKNQPIAITVYGEGDPGFKHLFEWNIYDIKIREEYEWKRYHKRSSSVLDNPRYYRVVFNCECNYCRGTVLEIKFWIIKNLQEYTKLIDDKNTLII